MVNAIQTHARHDLGVTLSLPCRWFISLSHYFQAFNHPFGGAGFRNHVVLTGSSQKPNQTRNVGIKNFQ